MKSIMYLSPKVYDFFLRIIHGKNYFLRFKLISRIIGKNKKVLDLGCGTGQLYRFLDKSCEYEGWDLNEKFVGSTRTIKTRCKSVFDFEDYPKVDVIVMSDLLHHVMPNHKELLTKAKEKAKMVIVLESKSAIVNVNNRLIYHLFKAYDKIIGDNDGINPYEERMNWFEKEEETYNFFSDFNPISIQEVGSDYLIVFKNN